MKHYLLFLLVLATTAFADSQRFVFFNAPAQSIAIYRETSDGFRPFFSLAVTDLAAPQQATVSASLGWLQAQLVEGETLTFVAFEPYQIPDDSLTPEVEESGLGLRASITGSSDSGGERTITIDSKDVPSEVRTGLVGLWEDLAAVPIPTPTPAPEPTPTPEP